MSKSGTIRSFDVDFSPCACPGGKSPTANLTGTMFRVIPVTWRRLDSYSAGSVEFKCGDCSQTWTMQSVESVGSGIRLDSSHPEEIARRRAIAGFERMTVNLFEGHRDRSQTDRMIRYMGAL